MYTHGNNYYLHWMVESPAGARLPEAGGSLKDDICLMSQSKVGLATTAQWSRNDFWIGGAKVYWEENNITIISYKINENRIHT